MNINGRRFFLVTLFRGTVSRDIQPFLGKKLPGSLRNRLKPLNILAKSEKLPKPFTEIEILATPSRKVFCFNFGVLNPKKMIVIPDPSPKKRPWCGAEAAWSRHF